MQALEHRGQEQERSTPQSLSDCVACKDGIALIPYGEANGSRTLADDTLMDLYDEMVSDGVIGRVFDKEIPTAESFITFAKDPRHLLVFAVVDGTLLGFGWLSEIKRNSAQANFAAVSGCWGKRSVEMGERILTYWFALLGDDGPIFDVLLGLTPSRNKLAVRFIQKLGCVIVGEIPYLDRGKKMTISYIERNDHG